MRQSHSPLRLTRRAALVLGAAAALSATGAARAGAPALTGRANATRTVGGRAFGTEWRINLPAGSDGDALRRRIEPVLARIDARMSPWRPDSEVSRLNAGDAGAWTVSAETEGVAQAALAMADTSGGAFDPTVGPLVARWGFGPIQGEAGPWRGLSVGDRTIAKAEPGLTLDLCGIAKGHALDRMADALDEAGHDDFLADLGGELLARGRHPSGRVWRVGIEDPRPDRAALHGTIALDGRAVATSGDRAQSYELGGRRYNHVIDPGAKAPVDGRLRSVSVVADTAMEADAWATALMASGGNGPALARAQGRTALFLFEEPDGLRSVATGGFDMLKA